MIKFEIDSSNEGIETYLDGIGVNELISYLDFIKRKQEHMHLVVGAELTESANPNSNINVKHVKLIYIE